MDSLKPYTLAFEDEVALCSKLFESSIDFPRKDLDLSVWKKEGVKYQLRGESKKSIIDAIKSYEQIDLLKLSERIWIIGSICTNLYEDDSDIDVHLVLDESVKNPDAVQKAVKQWTNDEPFYIQDHPIQLYIQNVPEQDLISDGIYSLDEMQWVKGPYFVDNNYNPYEVYHDVIDRISSNAQLADIHLGELRRDVIDYEVLKDAYSKLPNISQEKVKLYLNMKLEEIDHDIEQLLIDKKQWVDLRRQSSIGFTADEFKSNVNIIRSWKNSNALFKFINRYGYFRVISELEKIVSKDTELTDQDVKHVRRAIEEVLYSEDLIIHPEQMKGIKAIAIRVGDAIYSYKYGESGVYNHADIAEKHSLFDEKSLETGFITHDGKFVKQYESMSTT